MAEMNNITPEDIRQADDIEVTFDQVEQCVNIVLKKEGTQLKTEVIKLNEAKLKRFWTGTQEGPDITKTVEYDGIAKQDFYYNLTKKTLYIVIAVTSSTFTVIKINQSFVTDDTPPRHSDSQSIFTEGAIWVDTTHNQISVLTKISGSEQNLSYTWTDLQNKINFVDLGKNIDLRQSLTNASVSNALATKEYVDEKLSNKMSKMIVTELPTENIDTNTIYMILKTNTEENNIYDEYIYAKVSTNPDTYDWEKIGDTAVDLSDYYNKTSINNTVNSLNNSIQNSLREAQGANSNAVNAQSAADNAMNVARNASCEAAWANNNAVNAYYIATNAANDANSAITTANSAISVASNARNFNNKIWSAYMNSDGSLNKDISNYQGVKPNDLIIYTYGTNGEQQTRVWKVHTTAGGQGELIVNEISYALNPITTDLPVSNSNTLDYFVGGKVINPKGVIFKCLTSTFNEGTRKYDFTWEKLNYAKDEIDTALETKLPISPGPATYHRNIITGNNVIEILDDTCMEMTITNTSCPINDSNFYLTVQDSASCERVTQIPQTIVLNNATNPHFNILNSASNESATYSIDYTLKTANYKYIRYGDSNVKFKSLIIDPYDGDALGDIVAQNEYYTNRKEEIDFINNRGTGRFHIVSPQTCIESDVRITDDLHVDGSVNIGDGYNFTIGNSFLYQPGYNNILINQNPSDINQLGVQNIIIGRNTITAQNSFSSNTIIGFGNTVSGYKSVILGYGNQAYRSDSFLIGRNLISNTPSSLNNQPMIIMGAWNDIPNDDDIFVLGNGYDTSNSYSRSTALSVNTNGDLNVKGNIVGGRYKLIADIPANNSSCYVVPFDNKAYDDILIKGTALETTAGVTNLQIKLGASGKEDISINITNAANNGSYGYYYGKIERETNDLWSITQKIQQPDGTIIREIDFKDCPTYSYQDKIDYLNFITSVGLKSPGHFKVYGKVKY